MLSVYNDAKEKAIQFIRDMQDFTKDVVKVEWSEEYDDYYTGTVRGQITDVYSLDYTVSGMEYLSIPDTVYAEEYEGKFYGTWKGISDPENYEVQAWTLADTYYLQVTCELKPDGTFDSVRYVAVDYVQDDGSIVTVMEPYVVPVREGLKEYRLVNKVTGEIVDYGRKYLNEFKAKIIVLTDVEYELAEVNIWESDLSFYFSPVTDGKKLARIVRLSDEEIIGDTSHGLSAFIGKLPSSYLVPEDDPQYDKEGTTALGEYGYKLQERVFIYDIGLALIVFTLSGEYDRCIDMLKRMESEQNQDGSWNFSYDKYIGKLFHDYIRTGAIGWLGWGICFYMLESGDRTYLEMAEQGANYMLNRQVTDADDLRYGLLRGGTGAYANEDYSYTEVEIEWCSTEHNCSSLQYMWGIYLLTGKDKYRKAAEMMEYALKHTLYDEKEKRFYQGVNGGKLDKAWALDCTTWAGMAALSFSDAYLADACMNTADRIYLTSDTVELNEETDHYNMSFELNTPVSGHKPYADITADYAGAPDIVWTEGTLGSIALLMKVGRKAEAKKYLDEMVKLQNLSERGGLIYVTETHGSLPWEFHTWESVVSSAWLYIVLEDVNAIWSFHTKRVMPMEASKDKRPLKTIQAYGTETESTQ